MHQLELPFFSSPQQCSYTQRPSCAWYSNTLEVVLQKEFPVSLHKVFFIYSRLFRFPLPSFLKQPFPKYQSRENYVVNYPLTSVMNRILH